jgi:hypothetical protein
MPERASGTALATHALNNLLAQHMLRGSALTSTIKIAPPVSPNAGFASAVGRLLVVEAASCITVAPAPSRRAAVSRGTSRRGTPRANKGSGVVQCALCRAALPRNCARVTPNVKPAAGDRATTSSSAANAARGAVCGPMLIRGKSSSQGRAFPTNCKGKFGHTRKLFRWCKELSPARLRTAAQQSGE